jgi:hypothetical protein
LEVPYSLVAGSGQELGFIYSMLGNLSAGVLEKESEASRQVLRDNSGVVTRQDWSEVRDKLFPELVALDDPEWEREHARVEVEQQYAEAFNERISRAALRKEEISSEESRKAITDVLGEVKEAGAVEQALQFINGQGGEECLVNFSERAKLLLGALAEELARLDEENPRLRRQIIRRLTVLLHPSE